MSQKSQKSYQLIGGPLDGHRETPNYPISKGHRIWFAHIPELWRRQQVGYDFDGKRLIYGETRDV